jgi:ribosomal protein L19
LETLDPKGERKALFDYRRNPRSIKPGDIVRVTFKNGDPFNGVVLSIKLRGIDTSFLLRNELTRVAVELSVKVFNPNVQSVEIVQRAQRKIRRARLYYMRFVDYPNTPKSINFVIILLTALYFTGLASTTVAVWRTLSMPIFARRRPSWVAASVNCTSVRSDQFSIFRMYYYLFISNLFQLYNLFP